MQLFSIIFERLPMVWFLLGLLFNALALYVGFENKMSFIYWAGGWACCVYGLALYFLQHRERPRQSAKTRLSPNFISVGATNIAPEIPKSEGEATPEETPAD
ncbi:MAG: hypothetical protein GTO71_04765 [Woeseiaceae bacterium]|nr:hypothetical protein [Woeseiaceae bacterium]NIP20410.1 hypothetical protein [Woeseiaceae bacterium]NIS89299.1 hypothetical protein [Woeseiaceae bacterium]